MPFFIPAGWRPFAYVSMGLLLLLQFAHCPRVSQTKNTLFEQMRQSGVNSENSLQPTEELNIITYLYYYNGGGVAATDINGDGLADLFFTNNQQPNRYYINLGNWQFEDRTDIAGVAGSGQWSTGVSVVDVNGDGLPDIYVCQVAGYQGLQGGNELFIQQKDGSFKEEAAKYGLDFQGFATQAYWFDYDGDGDLDMYLLCHSVHNDATFGPASWRKTPDPVAGDRLYENLQDPQGQIFFRLVNEITSSGQIRQSFEEEVAKRRGKATPFSAKLAAQASSQPLPQSLTETRFEQGLYASKIGYGLSAAVADLTGNGRPDLYVCNDFSENDYLYFNQPNPSGHFHESIRQAMGHTSNFSMGSDVGDIDNDGQLDLFTLDMRPADDRTLKHTVSAEPYNVYSIKREFGYHHQYPRNCLQWNRGQGQFSEIGQMAGVAASDWSWSALFADYDLDGHTDIFVTNGIWQRPNDLDYLKFTSNEQATSQVSNLELANQMPPGLVANVAFKNLGNKQFTNVAAAWGLAELGASAGAAYADFDQDGYLDLVVNNLNAPASLYRNTSGDGVEVAALVGSFTDSLYACRMYADGRLELRWSSQLSGHPIRLLLSDGTYRSIATTAQRGFQSQSENRWVGRLAAGVEVHELSVGAATVTNEAPVLPLHYLSVIENSYTDFDAEPLQPWARSDEGPAFAHAHQGKEVRTFIGAAHGRRAGQLVWGSDGVARMKAFPATSPIGQDSLFEDVAAVFFDANADGLLDLYVVSGGGQSNSPQAFFTDRLYLASPNGWQRCEDCLPKDFLANGSCVLSADFNQDGYPDLFVGGRGQAGYYGQPGESQVLLNDGQGHFIKDPNWQFSTLGQVTAAAYLPASATLVVVGEWMPVSLLQRGSQQWKKEEIPYSEGMWRCLLPTSEHSFLAGNWGWNSALGKPSATEPLRLYTQDIDQNGKPDPILTYQVAGQEYTLADKDELSAQLPTLRKNNLSYANFAARTFAENFPMLRDAKPQRVHTLSHTQFSRNKEGKWEARALADDLQLTALNDLIALGDSAYLLAGGEAQVLPRIGRQDAAALQYIRAAELLESTQGQPAQLLKRPPGIELIRRMQHLGDGRVVAIGY